MKVTSEIKVGIFASLAIILFISFIAYFRLSKLHMGNYNIYTVTFSDLSGLSKKSDVKIAGVKVGWVDDIYLQDGGHTVDIRLCVNPEVQLRADAIAEIRQEGLLGTKFLDLNPGNINQPMLISGQNFYRKGHSSASMEDVIHKIRNVAENVEELTETVKNNFGYEQQKMLTAVLQNIHDASEKIASFSDTLATNQMAINSIVGDIKTFSQNITPLSDEIKNIATKLDSNVLPAFQESMERISDVFDRDFGSVANNVNNLVNKIDQGQGLVGKIVNDDRMYDDICTSFYKVRSFLEGADKMAVVCDSHFESMFRPGEDYEYKDGKGYLGFRFHTSEDQYYILQLVGSQRGTIIRNDIYANYEDQYGRPYTLEDVTAIGAASEGSFRTMLPRSKIHTFTRDTTKYSFQFAKVYDNLIGRIGLFENAFGFAVDYELPLDSDYVRWITTFEAFDFHGQNRLDDRRPHLKWLNRLFFLKNIYMAFGVDDFVSMHNTNAFFGIGVRLVDDDFKNIIGKLGLFSGTGLFTS